MIFLQPQQYDLFLVKGDLISSKDANRSQLTKIGKLEKTLSELTNTKEEKEAEIVKFLEEIKILNEQKNKSNTLLNQSLQNYCLSISKHFIRC